jgi:starch phosphorylase
MRLWSARAADPMRLDAFNKGEHLAALPEQVRAEAISKILYPSDETPAGQELRLRQEYFFVSASLRTSFSSVCASMGISLGQSARLAKPW